MKENVKLCFSYTTWERYRGNFLCNLVNIFPMNLPVPFKYHLYERSRLYQSTSISTCAVADVEYSNNHKYRGGRKHGNKWDRIGLDNDVFTLIKTAPARTFVAVFSFCALQMWSLEMILAF
jgi:hypothetical protein